MAFPLVFEINTRCWLRELSDRESRAITLANIPGSEFEVWQRLGFTHIWLMGVWTGGPRSRKKAFEPSLCVSYGEALPDWTDADVVCSPYAIADYQVSSTLGGADGLQAFRCELKRRGLKLLLDFVPNHLGMDHRWLIERPELFVQATKETEWTFRQETGQGPRWLAFGKDPNFGPWTDTVQLDYRKAETRAAMLETLQAIANLCDGVRCDMAMLVLNQIFWRTWQVFPSTEPVPVTEFWSDAIRAVKKVHPDFLFLAEVYWSLESRLQVLGFDYTYDKELYDRLVARDAAGTQRHVLTQPVAVLSQGAHFLENHDERRVARLLPFPEHRAALLAILCLPGLRLLHEGQLTGSLRRLPVQLQRRAKEPVNQEIEELYIGVLHALKKTVVGQTTAVSTAEVLLPESAWAGNPTAENFLLVQWGVSVAGFILAVVNLARHPAQCYAPVKLSAPNAQTWRARDLLGREQYERSADELREKGFYLDVPASGAQLFEFSPL